MRGKRSLLADLALLLCPRDFREGYRRDFGAYGVRDAVDIARTGLVLRAESVWRDAAFALRTLRKAKLFTFVAVMTLALAISVNAVVFGAIDAIALKPLPFVQPQRLVMMCYRPVGSWCGQLDNGVIGTYAQRTKTLQGIAAFQFFPETLLGHGAPQALQAYASSPNVFQVLGVRPELGSFFDAKHWFGRAVLSDPLWRSQFGANPRAVGSIINLGGAHFEIVGVAPRDTYMPVPGEAPQLAQTLWVAFPPTAFAQFHAFNDWTFARLLPHASAAQAAADVDRVTSQIVRRYPIEEKGLSIAAVPFGSFYYADARKVLLLMLAAVFAVLLIACANVANLVLVRCVARGAEFAVRNALGASRRRVLQQVTVEIGILAAIGGALGLLLAALEVRGLVALGSQSIVPGVADTRIDGRVVAFTFGVIVIATLLAGIIPAATALRRNVTEALKPAGRGGDAAATKRFRFALGAVQIALAFAVIAASGALYRNFTALANAPTGIDAQGVYVAKAAFNGPRYSKPARRSAFIRDVLARLTALPEIESAAAALPNPYLGDGAEGYAFKFPGRTYAPGTEPRAALTQMTPGYLRLLGVRLLAGRAFNAGDTAGRPRVAIVDRHFAQLYFPGRSAIGAQILVPVLNGAAPEKSPYGAATIVGVAGDIPLYGQPDVARLYVPQAQNPSHAVQIFVKTRIPDPHLRIHVAAAVAAVNPREAIYGFDSLQHRIDAGIAPQRTLAAVVGVVALIALLLALAGIYAIVAYSVEQQRHELGVRIAVGATRADVLRLVLRGAMGIAGVGIAAGIAIAVAGSRVLFGGFDFDPAALAAAFAVVAVSALLAAAIPALRAARVDPAVALRYE